MPAPSFTGQAAEEHAFRHTLGDDLSRFLRGAAGEEIIISRKRKPTALLIGSVFDGDWSDYQLENDPRFQRRIEQARKSLREGRGVRLKDVEPEPES